MTSPVTPGELDAIEAALKEATPGPWSHDANELWACVTVESKHGPEVATVASSKREQATADAHLIAHAPTWLGELLAEVRMLRDLVKIGPPPPMPGDVRVAVEAVEWKARAFAVEAALAESQAEVERMGHAMRVWKDDAERLHVYADRLRAALEKYGGHAKDCHARGIPRRRTAQDSGPPPPPEIGPCTCGLDAALATEGGGT